MEVSGTGGSLPGRTIWGMMKWKTLPEVRPKKLRDRLTVAWVAYKSQETELERGKAECELSILYFQTLMSYASESAAEKALTRLRKPVGPRESGWLVVTRKARGLRGNHYRLGALGEEHSAEWAAIGETLFGPGGILEPYRCRPAFLDKGLTPYGCLILAFIEKFGPVSLVELEEALETYMGVKVVRRRVKHLKSYELVIERNGRFSVPNDIRKRVEDFETSFDLDVFQRELEGVRGKRWLDYQREVQGSVEIRTLKSNLRKLDCFYCLAPAPPSGGQVEHFPPKFWGGSDATSLLLPVCKSCNTTHGGRLQNAEAAETPTFPSPLTIKYLGSREEAVAFFLRVMLSDNFDYAVAMNQGQVAEARRRALAHSETWAAIRLGGDAVRFVDTSDGEIHQGTGTDPFLELEAYLQDYSGIPEMISPLSDTSRRRAKRVSGRGSRTWGRWAP
jgi:hypothetical protein